ncbi:MAG: pseudouridine synthase [Candidatus Saccharimonadales bacterium]
MRINKYVAQSSNLSRRAADEAIADGRVVVNGKIPIAGYDTKESDTVTLDGRAITPAVNIITIMLHKPVGYVVSRDGQGSKTIYALLPEQYQNLQPIGRLDKDSSGLLLLTNDGNLANELTHPSRQKTKIYEIELDKPLQPLHQQMVTDYGIQLDDGPSKFMIEKISTDLSPHHERKARALGGEIEDVNSLHGEIEGRVPLYRITMHEGRNRQIRRTFQALGYTVTTLHRTHFGPYALNSIKQGKIRELNGSV